MSEFYTEANYEASVIELFRNMGYSYVYAPDLERNYRSPFYEKELDSAIHRLNPGMPEEAISEALINLKTINSGDLVQKNEVFMDYLQNGIKVQYYDGQKKCSGYVYLADYRNPENNSFVIANQWSFIENSAKRPDIILFLNGLPVVLIELKSPSRENTDVSEGYRQIRNYMKEIPSMFVYNCILAISDQLTSKAGTITSTEEWFKEWKSKDGNYENTRLAQFDTFFEGMFQKKRLLDIIKNFICFTDNGTEKKKVLAQYHQYFGVRKAIESTKKGIRTDGKGGVFWHTQGSGKSLSMVFYTHLLEQEIENPTVVVLTDQNVLDAQLYEQFEKHEEFLRQKPKQATCRKLTKSSTEEDVGLKNFLDKRQANGIIFTTMQKFEESSEPLSERRNIVVIADEAHRGQYGNYEKYDEEKKKMKIGFARIVRNNIPNATFIGFTGTPISKNDRNTRNVFGDYIDVYDMTQAVEDGTTCPVYYECRRMELNLNDDVLHEIDVKYDLLSKESSSEAISKSKTDLGQLETILGNDTTINAFANDVIYHYENFRADILDGKAMIVAPSRLIALKIYKKILELRPEWQEKVKVVMTGSNNDPEEWHSVTGNKQYREKLAEEFKKNDSELKIAIVVDMWQTGFDVPSLSTMYLFKYIEDYNLMQTMARLNRVFHGKEGGLIVDYIGIADVMKRAMKDYSARDRENFENIDIKDKVYPKFCEKLSRCREMLSGFNYSKFLNGSNLERSKTVSDAVNFFDGPNRHKDRENFLKEALLLHKALSLCSSLVDQNIRIECAFFESVRALVLRMEYGGGRGSYSLSEINEDINKLLKSSVKDEGIVNQAPDIKKEFSLFDPRFIDEISKMEENNLTDEFIKNLLRDKAHVGPIDPTRSDKFSRIIQDVMKQYREGLISSEEVISKFSQLKKQVEEDNVEIEKLGLSGYEAELYEVLTDPQPANDSFADVNLLALIKNLLEILRKNMTRDWKNQKNHNNDQAMMRMTIKRSLKKWKYPDDVIDFAVNNVMKQCEKWTDDFDLNAA